MQEAEKWIEAGLAAAGLTPADLPKLKGSDPRKLALAQKLWRETIVSQPWIAERLHMRSAANVSQQLRRLGNSRLEAGLPRRLRTLLKRTEPGSPKEARCQYLQLKKKKNQATKSTIPHSPRRRFRDSSSLEYRSGDGMNFGVFRSIFLAVAALAGAFPAMAEWRAATVPTSSEPASFPAS